MSQELDEEANEHTPQHFHRHLLKSVGCGDEEVSAFARNIKERAFDNRARDRLLHMDEIDQANLEGYLSARRRRRRRFLQTEVASWAL